ncbi:MAG: Hsp20/alpha crystallin family protein [Dehalococcoidia bacterium]|nr:Hsp20/alpha crystallin family protein [Dehalococcoidia bacterium]
MIRWEPFRELAQLRTIADQMMEEAFSRPSVFDTALPSTDVYATDNDLVVRMALPGYRPEDVEITTTGDTLLVRGQHRQESQQNEPGKQYLRREMTMGRFSRTIAFPFDVDASKAQASFEHGILTITLPKAEAVKPRRIAINAPSTPVEATARPADGAHASEPQPVQS